MLMTPLLIALLTTGCFAAAAGQDDTTPTPAGGAGAASPEPDPDDPGPAGAGTSAATDDPATPAGSPRTPAADEDGGTGGENASALRIPVQQHSGGPRWMASLNGRLDGAVGENGTACLWIGRRVLIWPAGYGAAADPLRVLDPDGNTVATVGDEITLGGGHVKGNPVDAEALSACGDRGSFWAVGNVAGR